MSKRFDEMANAEIDPDPIAALCKAASSATAKHGNCKVQVLGTDDWTESLRLAYVARVATLDAEAQPSEIGQLLIDLMDATEQGETEDAVMAAHEAFESATGRQ